MISPSYPKGLTFNQIFQSEIDTSVTAPNNLKFMVQ